MATIIFRSMAAIAALFVLMALLCINTAKAQCINIINNTGVTLDFDMYTPPGTSPATVGFKSIPPGTAPYTPSPTGPVQGVVSPNGTQVPFNGAGCTACVEIRIANSANHVCATLCLGPGPCTMTINPVIPCPQPGCTP